MASSPPAAYSCAGQTNFLSLPRELRDMIYSMALPNKVTISSPSLRVRKNVFARSHDVCASMALLDVRSSTAQVAHEAREHFFGKNAFDLRMDSIAKFLTGNDGHRSGPGRFEVTHYVRRLTVMINFVNDESIQGPGWLRSKIQPLLACPSLEAVTISVCSVGIKQKDCRVLKAVAVACREIAAKLGPKCQFVLFCPWSLPRDGLGSNKLSGDLAWLKSFIGFVVDKDDRDTLDSQGNSTCEREGDTAGVTQAVCIRSRQNSSDGSAF